MICDATFRLASAAVRCSDFGPVCLHVKTVAAALTTAITASEPAAIATSLAMPTHPFAATLYERWPPGFDGFVLQEALEGRRPCLWAVA